MTALLVALSAFYFLLGVAEYLNNGLVPMAVFIWGGLILILGWWAHDAIRNRQEEVGACAYRTS